MKKLELLPTEDNLVNCLYNDSIGRNQDIVYFYNILMAQEENSAIAIDGKWGSGKTFFVRQTQMVINALNLFCNMEEEQKCKILSRLPFPQKTTADESDLNNDRIENYSMAIYYDSWKNDNDVDPVLSLIYEITKQLNIEFSIPTKSVIKSTMQIAESLSGHKGIVDALSSEDKFKEFIAKKKIDELITVFFSRILEERCNRLVIFIDELDRCKPSYAVQLLEQIKHYIIDDRITFVFSVNIEQLQHTIKAYYGDGFDACRYLDRFFDRRMDIPPANLEKYYSLIGLESSYIVDKVTDLVIKKFGFGLREISRYYSQVYTAVNKPIKNGKYDFSFPEEKGTMIIMTYIVPLLIGLRIADITTYNQFIDGNNMKPLIELFEDEDFDYILNELLDNNETFVEQEGKVLVHKEDIIKKLYDSIFNDQIREKNYRTRLGQYVFNIDSKEFAIKSSSLLSKYADIN